MSCIVIENWDWKEEAACKNSVQYFFPTKITRRRYTPRALAICAECPVKQECGDFAKKNNEEYGVWGGEDLEQPRRDKRNKRIAKRKKQD